MNNKNLLNVTKLSERAKLPHRGSKFSAGLDLHSASFCEIEPGQRKLLDTGISIEIPPGHYGRIAPRSGNAFNHGLDVLAGVIDSDYRGEIKVLLINFGTTVHQVELGSRIAQLIIEKIKLLEPRWVNELDETDRGDGGFGSTGS